MYPQVKSEVIMSSMTGNLGMRNTAGSMAGKRLKGYSQTELPQYTPEQMQLFQSLFGHLQPDSFLSKLAGGSQEGFEQMEAPALQQFSGLQGNIASRFSGMGAGARRSSGFQNTMNQASQDFAGQLQSQRMGLQSQAIRDLMGMGNQLLGQRPYESVMAPKQLPFWKQLALGAGQAGAEGASSAAMMALMG